LTRLNWSKSRVDLFLPSATKPLTTRWKHAVRSMAEFIVFLGPPTVNELLEDWSSPGPVAFERFVDEPKQPKVPAPVLSKPLAALPAITSATAQSRPTSRPSIASQTSTQSLTPSILVEGSYNDGPAIQPPNFRFDVDQLVPLSKCKTVLENSGGPDLKVTINVLGRVDSIGPLQTLNSTRTGEPLKLLKFVVSDDSTCRTGIGSLQVLAWGCVPKPLLVLRLYLSIGSKQNRLPESCARRTSSTSAVSNLVSLLR
jgi:hypothetical protein